MKKEAPIEEQNQPGHPELVSGSENDTADSKRAALIAASATAAAALAMAKESHAATPFDDAVNSVNPAARTSSNAQMVNGATPDRFDMVLSAAAPGPIPAESNFYRAQFRVEPDLATGGVVFERLGPPTIHPASSTNPSIADYIAVPFVRPDGSREDVVRNMAASGSGALSMNGTIIWPSDCSDNGIASIHPSARNPRELKVCASFPQAFGAEDEDVYRVSIDVPDLCADIEARLAAALAAGQDPCEAGILQCNAETTWGRDGRAPENLDFAIRFVSGIRTDMLKFNPATNQYDIYMERRADGCYDVESVPPYDGPIPVPETGLGYPSALLPHPLTVDGRTIYPYAAEFITPTGGSGPYPDGEPHLQAGAFEKMPDGTICEVPLAMAADEAAIVDDDGDGVPNSDDNCQWVQESAQIDVTGPDSVPDGIGDACQTVCENWPAVNPPPGTTPSDIWACATPGIAGYSHAYKRGDGSTLLTNYPLPDNELSDGTLNLPQGSDIYWLHANAAQYPGPEIPSPIIAIPPGNSTTLEVLSTDHPDGTPGTATFTHIPRTPGATPITVPLTSGETRSFDPGLGDTLGLEGSVARVRVGSENLCTVCSPACPEVCPPPPDGGTPDGGTPQPDGGTPDSGTATPDAGPGAPDGGPAPDAGTGTPDGGSPTPDSGPLPTPDSGPGTPDGGSPKPDSGPRDSGNNPRPDAGPPPDTNPNRPDANGRPDAGPTYPPDPRLDIGTTTPLDSSPDGPRDAGSNTSGCHCSIGAPEYFNHRPDSLPDGMLTFAAYFAIALFTRRRMKRRLEGMK